MGAGSRRREVRRAFGHKASDALLDMDSRTVDAERFLLMWRYGGFFRRAWSLITGRF